MRRYMLAAAVFTLSACAASQGSAEARAPAPGAQLLVSTEAEELRPAPVYAAAPRSADLELLPARDLDARHEAHGEHAPR